VPSPANYQNQHRVAITKSITAALAPRLSGRFETSAVLAQRVETLAKTDPQIKCLILRGRNGKVAHDGGRGIDDDYKLGGLGGQTSDVALFEIKSGTEFRATLEVHFHPSIAARTDQLLRISVQPADVHDGQRRVGDVVAVL